MLRERSVSPPPAATQAKRKAVPPSAPATPLTTPYTAEQMDGGPGLDQKKDFLLMFQLSHVSQQQRRGNEPLITHKNLLLLIVLDATTPCENKSCELFLYLDGKMCKQLWEVDAGSTKNCVYEFQSTTCTTLHTVRERKSACCKHHWFTTTHVVVTLVVVIPIVLFNSVIAHQFDTHPINVIPWFK